MPHTPAEGGKEDDCQVTKRSERKRQRESKRRSDMSKAFDELASFILSESGDRDTKHMKRRKSNDDTPAITRLEMIGLTIRNMRRLHSENEERKRIIASFQENGGAAPNDNVLVMVPTLKPMGEEPVARAHHQYPPPYAGYPPHYYFHGNHPHQQPLAVSDYGQEEPGSGPQYHSTKGYRGRRAPPLMSPPNAPPPYRRPHHQRSKFG